ncbi:MAG: BatA domain-containing protein [Chitinophagales bacterium]|nr:BatA domain-containing protein [Chitinophagales bacterium]MDW8428550.1 BatA domain-containing protein [Chitinophagales bacterium]
MVLLYPAVLIALLAIAIPIIVHLFQFRRYKTIYFPSVRFLKQATEQTDARQRLRHLLILLCRIMTIVFLVLAFAQPLLKRAKELIAAGKQRICIYVDNSFSMGRASDEGTVLDEAKSRAEELVRAYGQEDEFQVLTNEFSAAQQQWVDREEALRRIRAIMPSAYSRTLNSVLQRQRDALRPGSGHAFLFSDFQKNLLKEPVVADTLVHTTLVPLTSAGQGNLFIDTCWLYAPVQLAGQQARLMVRLRNLSSAPVREGRVTLTINDEIKAISDFALEGGTSRLDTLVFTFADTGWNRAEVTLTDHPVVFDDTYYFTLPVHSRLEVVALSAEQPNPYVQAVFGHSATFRLTTFTGAQVPYDRVQLADFVVATQLDVLPSGLVATLKEFLEQGGNVALFPSPKAQTASYNELLQAVRGGQLMTWRSASLQLNRVTLQDELVQGIFHRLPDNTSWPEVKGAFGFDLSGPTLAQPLWSFSDGMPAIVKVPVGRGLLFISTLPLDRNYGDWMLHPLFAPLLFNMATVRAYVPARAYTLGKESRLMVKAEQLHPDGSLLLRNVQSSFIPPQRREQRAVILFVGRNEETAGFYEITDASNQSYGWVAFNYDRSESDFSFLNEKELQQLGETLRAQVVDEPAAQLAGLWSGNVWGLTLWKVSLILALLFLLLETALLKLR